MEVTRGLKGIVKGRVYNVNEVIKCENDTFHLLIDYVDTQKGMEMREFTMQDLINNKRSYQAVKANILYINDLIKDTEKVIGKRTTYSNVPKSLIEATNLMEIFLQYLYNRGIPVEIIETSSNCQWIEFNNGQTKCLYTTQAINSDLQRLNLIFDILPKQDHHGK